MRFFKVVLASALGYILTALLFIGILAAIIMYSVSNAKPTNEIPANSILNLKLNYDLVDRAGTDPASIALTAFSANNNLPIGLNKILTSIKNAESDSKIKGIVLDLTTLSSGYAKLTEVRNALESFKQSGKFIYAFADYYYFPTYYLGSVADSVFIHPEGEMAFNGMVAEMAFFSNTLKKLGVDMQVVKEGRYKGAVEQYTRENLSEDNKAQIQIYINSLFNQTLKKMSASRGIEVEKLKSDADELKVRKVSDFIDNGYIDAAVYRDQLYSIIKKRMGIGEDDRAALISEQRYSNTVKAKGKGSKKIAVVYASGDIVGGKGDGTQIAADDLAATLKKMRKNKGIDAVVLRVDSRGGSSLASDIIWREAKLLADTKTLIVSMSDVAASGGYYIASPAHKIVAEATTITGSIGVFGLIPNMKKLLNDKLGVNLEYVGTGKHSDIGRLDRNLTPTEREYIEDIIERVYSTFLNRVAVGRDMTKEEVHEIAQGRVWTGIMAQEVGLVDEIGGLNKAIALAAEAIEAEEYKIKEYPRIKEPFEEIVSKLQGGASLQAQIKSTEFGKYVSYLEQLDRWGSKHSVQMMMPYEITVKNYSLR